MPSRSGAWDVERVRLTAGTAALVAVALLLTTVVRNVFLAAHQTIGWAVASGMVALVLTPVASWLSRYVRRVLAIFLTLLSVVILVGAVLVGVFANLRDEVDRLTDVLPAAAAEIEADARVGEIARDFRLGERVESFVDGLEQRLSERAAIEGAVGTVPSYFINAVLVVFLLLWGPRIAAAALSQFSDERRRERVAEVGTEAVHRARRYLLGALAQAAVIGTGVGLVCWTLDLPAPTVLGLLVAILSFVPYFGVMLGAVPVLLLAAAFQPGWQTALLSLAFVVAQVLSVLATDRLIHGRSMRVGPAVLIISALVGFEVYGPGGAFYGAALVVLGVAVIDSLNGEASEPALGAT